MTQMHQKQLVQAFNQRETEEGRAVTGFKVCHVQTLKLHNEQIFYIVVMWSHCGLHCHCNRNWCNQPRDCQTGAKIFGHVFLGQADRRQKIETWMKEIICTFS